MKKTKGFSIGEVMVAVFIMLVGIVGAIMLTARSIQDLGDSRESIVATLLAQEGTELVRNVRDNNVTQMTCGMENAERCTAFDGEYGFPSEGLGEVVVKCSADHTLKDDSGGSLMCTNPKEDLYINTETKTYSHNSGGATTSESEYKRGIYISYDYTLDKNDGDNNDKVAVVTSVVVYGEKGLPEADEIKDIQDICKISEKCAYSQTRLTSWINYGD